MRKISSWFLSYQRAFKIKMTAFAHQVQAYGMVIVNSAWIALLVTIGHDCPMNLGELCHENKAPYCQIQKGR